jgi:hypothetical protein
MKMQVFTVDVPTNRPFISEMVEVVRLSDVKSELKRLEDQAKSWRDSAAAKRRRFEKSVRFEKAYNYWTGSFSACEGLLYSIRRFFE